MTDFKPVTLTSPDGRDYVATTAIEANDLQFGHGYKPRSTKSEAPVKETKDTKESK